MKNIINTLFILCLTIGLTATAYTQARVQVIHNSADAAAEVVDVWLDDMLLIDNFEFRTATPFIDAPAGQDFRIAIQPANSTSPIDPIWEQSYTLQDGNTYILVANGLVNQQAYTPFVPFNIYVYPIAREMARNMGNTDVMVFHGSTDAPTVDVVEVAVGAGTIVDDIPYGEFTPYLELGQADYSLQIRDQSGTEVVAQYAAPIQSLGLENQAISVLASGFLDPSKNSFGPAFGLWVATAAGGDLIPLPVEEISTARLQLIHNSADIAANMVDVWINGEMAIDDFTFRTATPYVDVPANAELVVAIQPSNSTSVNNPLWEETYVLTGGERYLLIANGIVNPMGYSPTQSFDVFVFPQAEELAEMGMNKIKVFHGSTDAPTIDIYSPDFNTTIVDNISYGEFQGYIDIPTGDYILELRDESGSDGIAQYELPLETFGIDGKGLTTIASGFLNPANNNNGANFGLWVALPEGGQLIELPFIDNNPSPGFARVQVIHNSADAAAEVVDVWLDDVLLIDNFEFRTATPFIDAPADTEFTISIKGPNSTNPDNAIWSRDYTLAENETYVLIANGIVSPSGYDPEKPFNIFVYPMGRENATNSNNTDVNVFHGSTDAPIVDVVEVGVGAGTIIDDIDYGMYSNYLELPTADYILEIRDETGTATVATYEAPLEGFGLGGSAITVVASGFLMPENNSEGAMFGLWVALPSGGDMIPLSITTSVAEQNLREEEFKTFPNPATDNINVSFELTETSQVEVNIYNVLGSMVRQLDNNTYTEGYHTIRTDISDLDKGMYFIQINTGKSQLTEKVFVQ